MFNMFIFRPAVMHGGFYNTPCCAAMVTILLLCVYLAGTATELGAGYNKNSML